MKFIIQCRRGYLPLDVQYVQACLVIQPIANNLPTIYHYISNEGFIFVGPGVKDNYKVNDIFYYFSGQSIAFIVIGIIANVFFAFV